MPRRAGLALLVALSMVAACKDSPTASNSATVTITIGPAQEFGAQGAFCPVFSPNPATITPGQTLQFTNKSPTTSGDVYVTFYPFGVSEEVDPGETVSISFPSGYLVAGQTLTYGNSACMAPSGDTYNYGKLTVTAGG